MKLKFCGLTRKEDIEAANETKPDFIGFVFAEKMCIRDRSDFCHRLVLFGREHCTARSPKCEGCPLGAVCPSYPIAK